MGPFQKHTFEAGEDSQPVQVRRIPALMTECEDTITSDAVAEALRKHLEKLTNVKDAVIKVVPRTDATTRPLTGRWVDSMHDDRASKARWTTRGYEQSERERGFLLGDTSDHAPQKNVVGRCSSQGTAVGLSTKLFWYPTEQRTRCGSSRLQRKSWDLTYGKLCQHSLDSKVR